MLTYFTVQVHPAHSDDFNNRLAGLPTCFEHQPPRPLLGCLHDSKLYYLAGTRDDMEFLKSHAIVAWNDIKAALQN